MDSYNSYPNAKEYEIPSQMQAVIACGRGFENLKVAQVPIPVYPCARDVHHEDYGA